MNRKIRRSRLVSRIFGTSRRRKIQRKEEEENREETPTPGVGSTQEKVVRGTGGCHTDPPLPNLNLLGSPGV